MQEINLTAKLSTGGSVPPVIDELSVTRNGTYTAGSGVDGFSPVVVNVPQSGVIESKNITENGTYTAGGGVDGFSPVVVNVEPTIESKTITENGTYTPGSGVDGFSPVVVNVPGPNIISKNITDNGTYTPGSGVDGFSPVVVNVPTYNPIMDLYYKPFVESDMRLTTGLSGDIKSEWVGNSSIGCTIQGTVDLRNYNNVSVTGYITDSYEYHNKTGFDRCQFVCGFTDEVFNSIILVNYNTGDHIVQSVKKTLTNEQTTNFNIDFELSTIEGDHLYFFISMLGVNGRFITKVL